MEKGKGWGQIFVPQGISRKAVGFCSLLVLGCLNDEPWFVSRFMSKYLSLILWDAEECWDHQVNGVQRQPFCIRDLGGNLISLPLLIFIISSTTDT